MDNLENSLSAIAHSLSTSSFDVAGGLNEAALNSFLSAHWTAENATSQSIYKGGGRADEVGLSYSYNVQAPATILLAPLSDALFAKIYSSWITSIPEVAGLGKPAPAPPLEKGTILDNPPPNVQVKLNNLTLNVKTDTGTSVDFNVSMTVTGVIDVITLNSAPFLSITPISAKIDDQQSVKDTIRRSLPQTGQAHDTDCVALEKLILYIVNFVIASRVGSFVKEFPLPVAVDLVQGLEIGNFQVEIIDKILVVLASLVSTQTISLSRDLPLLTDTSVGTLKKLSQETKRSGSQHLYSFSGSETAQIVAPTSVTSWPKRGLFLILHQRFFQALANTLINIDQSGGDSASVAGFSVAYGWRVRIFNPTAMVKTGALDILANFDGGGWAKATYHTHCGDIGPTVSIGADANPNISTTFSFQGQDLWMAAAPQLFPINWHVSLPWPFGPIVSWLLDALSDVAVLILNLIGYKWRHKLTSIPDQFPGTPVKFNAKFDPAVIQFPDDAALMALADLTFYA